MILSCCAEAGRAQQDTQLWFDFQVDYPFANQYLFEMEVSYQTVLESDSAWHSFNATPTFEYLLFEYLDIAFKVPVAYTIQTTGYNTFETNPLLEGRFHITQNKRVNTRFLLRLEKRFFRQLEESDWDSSTRLRLKAEATISINHPNLYHDKLWYAITDYEEFFVTDQQLDERYANRRRARLGLGYRLDYRNRFELVYTLQSSRNEIQDEFISTDNVIQLKYKMFLNPAKPTPQPAN